MYESLTDPLDAKQAFDQLFIECRDTCLWFWRPMGIPTQKKDRIEVLRQIEKHGTLLQFSRARELKKWL